MDKSCLHLFVPPLPLAKDLSSSKPFPYCFWMDGCFSFTFLRARCSLDVSGLGRRQNTSPITRAGPGNLLHGGLSAPQSSPCGTPCAFQCHGARLPHPTQCRLLTPSGHPCSPSLLWLQLPFSISLHFKSQLKPFSLSLA